MGLAGGADAAPLDVANKTIGRVRRYQQ